MKETRLKLYNTETREKEEITPLDDNIVRMYTCGPTIYNYAHIGNFRTYVFEDLLRRTIKFFDHKIEQVMNITDIEDKIIKGVLTTGLTLEEFTTKYKKAFFEDIDTLGIERVEHYPAATDYIDQMIRIIEVLMEEGIAYKGTDESIYFSIDRFPSYGRLSHLNIDQLEAAASKRVAVDEYDKEHVSDFALWKSYDPERDGRVYWESPFGKGRPGWHIECSAMAISILGEQIDIHCGGIDNMFPHHENEIAQSECYTQKQFVKHWLHSEHLLVDGKKMSKSKGNFYTLRDLLEKGYSGMQVRYMLMHTHYRTQLNFTLDGLDAAAKSLERFSDFIQRLRAITTESSSNLVEPLIESTLKTFTEALADDLNISAALAALFDLVREVNTLADHNKVSATEASSLLSLLEKCNTVLGVLPLEIEQVETPAELLQKLEQRERARKEKNWAEADRFRDEILAEGYLIEDTPQGARLKKA